MTKVKDNTCFRIVLLVLTLAALAQGFSTGSRTPASKPVNREDLPTLDVPAGTPPVPAPKDMASSDFYLPTYTLLRAGPVSFVRRVIDGRLYEQYVWKYMKDYQEDSLMTAQGNADAYLASAGT